MEKKIQQVLILIWNVHEVIVMNIDKKHHAPLLDDDSVRYVGYFLGKNPIHIERIRSLTYNVPHNYFYSLMDDVALQDRLDIMNYIRKILKKRNCNGICVSGTLKVKQGENVQHICCFLSLLGVRTLKLCGRIAYTLVDDFDNCIANIRLIHQVTHGFRRKRLEWGL